MDPVNCMIMHMLFLHPAYVKTVPVTLIWGVCFQAACQGGGDSFFCFSIKEFQGLLG